MYAQLVVKRKENSKHELEFMGPFPITQINNNGKVRFQKGIINDATNIRRICDPKIKVGTTYSDVYNILYVPIYYGR